MGGGPEAKPLVHLMPGILAVSKGAQTTGKFRDDLTGQPLPDDLVAMGQRKELDFFESKKVWKVGHCCCWGALCC